MTASLEQLITGTDAGELALTCAALQMIPENAEKAVRLMHVAALASINPVGGGHHPLSSTHLRRIFSHPEVGNLASQEDRYDDVWIQSISFYGGNYLASVGHFHGSTRRLQATLDACILGKSEMPDGFIRDAFLLTNVILRLSDQALRSANLQRGQTALEGRGEAISVPGKTRRTALTSRLVIGSAPLETLLSEPLLAPLCVTQGANRGALFDDAPTDDQLIYKPLLNRGGDYVLVSPLDLASSLVYHFGRLAHEYGCVDILDASLSKVLWAEATRSLSLMEAIAEGDASMRQPFEVRNYETVAGRRICVVALPPRFSTLNLERPYDPQPFPGSGTDIERVLHDIGREWVGRTEDLLFLVLQDTLGDPAILGFTHDAPKNLVAMSFDDLRVIATLRHHPLDLFRYAEALDRLERSAFVMSFSTLDTFAIYRKNGDSFYLSDGPQATYVSIVPASGRELREEAFIRLDEHLVLVPPDWNQYAKVMAEEGRDIAPLYLTLNANPPVYAVELPSGTIIVSAVGVYSNSWEWARDALRAVSYWLWQIVMSIDESWRTVPSWVTLEKEAALPGHVGWNIIVAESTLGADFTIRLQGDIESSFASDSDGFERELVRQLLTTLDPGGDSSSLDRIAPRGPKRMLSVLSTGKPSEIPASSRVRRVEDAVMSNILDELGTWLREDQGLETGHIPQDQRQHVLHAIVAHRLAQIQHLISGLEPSMSLEYLVAQDEALIASQNFNRRQLPRRLACFGPRLAEKERLHKSLTQSVESNVASRFLIEIMVGLPPQGGEAQLEVGLYEQLLALASDMNEKGIVSDTLHYGLSDIEMSILESGRLGLTRSGSYEAAIRDFGAARTEQEWANALGSGKLEDVALSEPSISRIAIDDESLRSAFEAEFGISLPELIEGIGALIFQETPLQDVYRRSLADVTSVLTSLEWSQGRIDAFFSTLCLGPRDAFTVNGSMADVAPFRYNRNLSYVRRPLLVQGEDVVFGLRRLMEVPGYLLSLVESGRFKAGSSEMRSLIGKVRGTITEGFNDAVATSLSAIDGSMVRLRVKKVGRLRLRRPNGQDLGDVDVLVAIPQSKQLWAIETKDFEVARTPAELSNEVEKFFSGTKSTMTLHGARVEWLRRNQNAVLHHTFALQPSRGWTVGGLVVVSEDIVARRLLDPAIPVLTLDEAMALIKNQGKRRKGRQPR